MVILLKLLASKSSEMVSSDDNSGKLKSNLDLTVSRQHEKVEKSDKDGFSDIEQLVKGKKFSRYISLILKIKFLFHCLNYSLLISTVKVIHVALQIICPNILDLYFHHSSTVISVFVWLLK